MEEEKQYIDFNEIKQYVNVKDEKLFLLYLREITKIYLIEMNQKRKEVY